MTSFSRCDSLETLLEHGCARNQIVSPQSTIRTIASDDFVDGDEGEESIQLRPQEVEVRLRPSESPIRSGEWRATRSFQSPRRVSRSNFDRLVVFGLLMLACVGPHSRSERALPNAVLICSNKIMNMLLYARLLLKITTIYGWPAKSPHHPKFENLGVGCNSAVASDSFLL